MPILQSRQECGPESADSVMGDSVPLNGVEAQAVRRVHMREQTAARQAAERHLVYPPISRTDCDRPRLVAERVAQVRDELARINAWHQHWLCTQGQ